MARNHHQEEDEFGDDEIAEETQELMQIIFGDPEEWNDVIETAPKQMRQACRVAKDKAAALRRYCIEAGLLKLPVRTKLGRSRQTCPKDVNRKRQSLEASLQKLFAKGRANGAGVEEFVWGISYGDGSIRIGSDEVLAPIWQHEGYMEKVRQQANNSKLTAQQFKDSLRSADIATLLSKHLSVPERKAAVTSLGPVCSPPMAVTSFNAAFGAASGRLAWWPSAVPLSKAWKLKADETIIVLEAMSQNIVTHFGAGTTLSEEEQKRGCLEVFKRCVVGPHVAAGLKGSDSRKVAIFELIGEKAMITWQLPATSGEGQEGRDPGAPSQHPAPRRVRRTKEQMGPQPFPCPRCVGEYSTAAALKAHRCKARTGAQPSTDSQTAAPGATAEGAHQAHQAGGTVPPSNGGEEEHWDDAPDGAMDELIEEVEKDAAQGTTEAQEAVRLQVAATEFLHSVQEFAAPFEQDSHAPSHLLQLLGDLLNQGDVNRKVLHVLHTMQGVGTVSTRLHKAGLDVAVPTDALLVEAHTETVVRHLRAGSGNWPRFIQECELLEDLAENMGGELAERWSSIRRVILDPSVATELIDKFDRDAVFKVLKAFVEGAKLALRNLDKAPSESGHGHAKGRQPPGADVEQEHEHGRRQHDGPPRAQAKAGQRDGGLSAQPGSGQRDAALNAQSGVGQRDTATTGQPGGGRSADEQSAQPGADQQDAAPNAQPGGVQRPAVPSAQRGGEQRPGAPSAQPGGRQRPEPPSAQPGEGQRPGVPGAQRGGEQRPGAPSAQPGEGQRPGPPSAQPGGRQGPGATSAQPGGGQGPGATSAQSWGGQKPGALSAPLEANQRDAAPSAQSGGDKRDDAPSAHPGADQRNAAPSAQPGKGQRGAAPGVQQGASQHEGAAIAHQGGAQHHKPPSVQPGGPGLQEGVPPSALQEDGKDHISPREQREGEERDGLPKAEKGPDDHARLPPRPTPLPSGCLKRTAASDMVPKGRGKKSKGGKAGPSGSAELPSGRDENVPRQGDDSGSVCESSRPPRRVASAGVSQVLKELMNGSRRR